MSLSGVKANKKTLKAISKALSKLQILSKPKILSKTTNNIKQRHIWLYITSKLLNLVTISLHKAFERTETSISLIIKGRLQQICKLAILLTG